MDLQGKKVLVFGAGISGIGSCGLLEKEGAEVILYDGNDKKDAEAMKAQLGDGSKVRVVLGAFPEEEMESLDLEDGTVEPFVSELEGFASGKKVALFGSYDWGDGEWMRTWAERMEQAGAQIVGGEGLICHGTPGADVIDECESLGREVAGL